MFFPEEMTELEIIVPERDTVAVTGVLANAGIFHQVDASYTSSGAESRAANGWPQKSSAYAALERKLLSVMALLNVEEGMPPALDTASIADVQAVRSATERLEEHVQAVIGDLADEQRQLERLQSYVQQLEPIKHVKVPINLDLLRHPRYVFSMLGVIPVDHVERLETSLGNVPFLLLTLWKDSRQAIVMLVGIQQHADILDRAARSAYLNPLDLPDGYQGTPQHIIDALQGDIARIRQRLAEQESTVSDLRETRREQLLTLLWQARVGRTLADALSRVGRLRYTYLIVGWLPASRLDDVTRQLKAISNEVLVEANPTRRESTERNVPVTLRSSGVLGAFQRLVTTYARPRYEEIDPTILLALTFPILFGAMFGDVGHGFVLMLLGGLLLGRGVRALRSLSWVGVVVTACGLAATAFGFLYGSVFGLEHVLPALWIRPMENIMQILATAIVAGAVLLTGGFLLGILNALVARDWGRMLFGHHGIAGLVLYWSLLGLAAGAFVEVPLPGKAFVVTAALSGLVMALSDLLSRLIQGRRPLIEGGAATYAVQVVFELFEALISFLSNSLSYVRVGAFAVAHAGLSAVVFILAEMVDPARGVGYWLVVAAGNLFVIGFEGMIVAIQTLRLEYYEFFSRFFTGGGTRYVPLVTPQGTNE